MLYHLINDLIAQFKYITFRASLGAMFAFLLCLILLPRFIAFLKKRKISERTEKKDSLELVKIHQNKSTTPTMGGVIIISILLITTLLWARLDNIFVIYAVLVTFSLGILGFIDDYLKLNTPHKHGLSKSLKFSGQAIIGLAVGFGLWYYFTHKPPLPENVLNKAREAGLELIPAGTELYIPLFKTSIELGLLYPFFVALVIVASSNAVNLTDGLDGLAIGCLVMAALGYSVIVYITGRWDYSGYLRIPYVPGTGELTIFTAALVGISLGFLWFNSHPAQIFMGDTGALSLGGALGLVAVCAKQELVLFIIGAIFVVEALSVILQVISYRGWGKRIFLIAPLHHHFQFSGMAESKITIRFWITAAILALLSLASLKIELF
ncbi:MAG: phospho-N-acetylmuramoyl-pentapeptide-transferase [Planctomycetota bacterium]